MRSQPASPTILPSDSDLVGEAAVQSRQPTGDMSQRRQARVFAGRPYLNGQSNGMHMPDAKRALMQIKYEGVMNGELNRTFLNTRPLLMRQSHDDTLAGLRRRLL